MTQPAPWKYMITRRAVWGRVRANRAKTKRVQTRFDVPVLDFSVWLADVSGLGSQEDTARLFWCQGIDRRSIIGGKVVEQSLINMVQSRSFLSRFLHPAHEQ